MAEASRRDRTKFRREVMQPLLDAGWLAMTIPDKPTSSRQKYRLTAAGHQFLEVMPSRPMSTFPGCPPHAPPTRPPPKALLAKNNGYMRCGGGRDSHLHMVWPKGYSDPFPGMHRMDTHYTPRLVARKLVAAAKNLRPSVIADLCAGRGDLLLEAEALWPDAKYAAVDIDHAVVRHLRRARPSWWVGRCDITNPLSMRHSLVLKQTSRRISLLLLNPPFTCRGGARLSATTETGKIRTSTAMYFLITALAHLHPTGSAIAILPFGALHNHRDKTAWDYISSKFRVSVVERPPVASFPDCSASTIIVRLSPSDCHFVDESALRDDLPLSQEGSLLQSPPVRIVRGCLPFVRSDNNFVGPVLVHSTNLRDEKVILNGHHARSQRRIISQPAVLLPRVGQITKTKIAPFDASKPIVLSDCVIALTTHSFPDAIAVHQRLINNFPLIRAQYVGTGAPFITLQRLTKTLRRLRVEVLAP